jgi:hypothetical protein
MERTGTQGTKGSALMAKPVMLTPCLSVALHALYCEVVQTKFEISGSRCSASLQADVLVTVLIIHMPRARGQPRRGTAWYEFDSQKEASTEI